ncbi:hypothetical protein NNX28_16970 [Arthrobacter sp. zg-Y859]|uniref:Uncharacterized protein n=1 Tax=Arthrobacter jinronghuae TaxID=2964609 RepID=A0ABT1NWX8_9MICC|nr:hypothetical protein [Arthrobacter jinronghuae]MCQ1951612.1 hypothetical protein [Arthrobacter jinronghuae]UWX79674.1 hypothetical protein N2K98_05610 [Arthrobacter jinronghuae]
MTVRVHLDPKGPATADANNGHFKDDDKVEYAYSTTDYGVLRVLAATKHEDDWGILVEFPPSAWHMVGGKRFVEDSSGLPAIMGGATLKKVWHDDVAN